MKGASFTGRYFFLIVCVFIEHAKETTDLNSFRLNKKSLEFQV